MAVAEDLHLDFPIDTALLLPRTELCLFFCKGIISQIGKNVNSISQRGTIDKRLKI